MEVQKVSRTGVEKAKGKNAVPTESISFQEVMSKGRSQIIYEKLTKMVEEIEEQGKKLAEHRTIDELRKYKKMVKQFMEEAVNNGLKLEEQRGFTRRGRTKIYKIVKEVDKKLIDLANDVLNKEKTQLDILKQVGEIQGLLINLYT